MKPIYKLFDWIPFNEVCYSYDFILNEKPTDDETEILRITRLYNILFKEIFKKFPNIINENNKLNGSVENLINRIGMCLYDFIIWTVLNKMSDIIYSLPIRNLIYKLNWYGLSKNPNAICILEQNLDKININHLSRNNNPDAIDILEKIMETVGWYNFSSWSSLCANPHAMRIINKNLDKVDWNILSANPSAIYILEKNLDKVNWFFLSSNLNAIHILEQNLDKVDWMGLSANPNAIHLLEQNLDKVVWTVLSTNPNAIHILEQNLDKVDWRPISGNINAIHIIEQNLDKVDWCILSGNPNAIHILENNLHKVNWSILSTNKNAIHILKQNIIKIDMNFFVGNQGIFTCDYAKMKERIELNGFKEELVLKVFHPRRLMSICNEYNIEFDALNELY